MTTGPRITVHIDRLRVRGVRRGDAAALADGLKTALTAQLAADPGVMTVQGADHLRVSLPPAAGQGPAAIGRSAGYRVAGALTRPKKGGR